MLKRRGGRTITGSVAGNILQDAGPCHGSEALEEGTQLAARVRRQPRRRGRGRIREGHGVEISDGIGYRPYRRVRSVCVCVCVGEVLESTGRGLIESMHWNELFLVLSRYVIRFTISAAVLRWSDVGRVLVLEVPPAWCQANQSRGSPAKAPPDIGHLSTLAGYTPPRAPLRPQPPAPATSSLSSPSDLVTATIACCDKTASPPPSP
jgi:hypothetical protein